MKRLISIGFLLIVGMYGAYAQSSINACGKDEKDVGGSISYSLGQVVYTYVEGVQGSLMQGVQLPYEILTVVGIEVKEINLSMITYPNPTTDYLKLKITYPILEDLFYTVTDIKGNLLDLMEITDMETQIDFSTYPSSVYFVSVIQRNRELKTFKIIKLK